MTKQLVRVAGNAEQRVRCEPYCTDRASADIFVAQVRVPITHIEPELTDGWEIANATSFGLTLYSLINIAMPACIIYKCSFP